MGVALISGAEGAEVLEEGGAGMGSQRCRPPTLSPCFSDYLPTGFLPSRPGTCGCKVGLDPPAWGAHVWPFSLPLPLCHHISPLTAFHGFTRLSLSSKGEEAQLNLKLR